MSSLEVGSERLKIYCLNFMNKYLNKMKDKISKKSFNVLYKDLNKNWINVNHDKLWKECEETEGEK